MNEKCKGDLKDYEFDEIISLKKDGKYWAVYVEDVAVFVVENGSVMYKGRFCND